MWRFFQLAQPTGKDTSFLGYRYTYKNVIPMLFFFFFK